jgi:hypothetical protein
MNTHNMLKLVNLLETTQVPKGSFSLYNQGAFCAVGLCAHALLGFSVQDLQSYDTERIYDAVSDFVDLESAAVWEVNDNHETFHQVATELRARYLPGDPS